MLFLPCQSKELGHNAFAREWLEGWLSATLPFLLEMVESAGKKKASLLCFSAAYLVILLHTQPPCVTTRLETYLTQKLGFNGKV